MAGKHRRAGRRGRDWIIDVLVIGFGLDAALTHQPGGAERAPAVLFLAWAILVVARNTARWRPTAVKACGWLSRFSAALFIATLKDALPTGAAFWMNSAAEWAVLAGACGATAWTLQRSSHPRPRHAG
jgi:hypothetical protein